jgi:hypothetical protein
LDGYLRGGLNSISNKKLKEGLYLDDFALNYRGLTDEESLYTDPQRDVINKMNEYLKTKKKK